MLLGCTVGQAEYENEPPPLSLVASVPSAGQGTECTPTTVPECGVPVDTAITLRFDRYLKPASAVRQAILVYTGSPNNGVGLLRPEYDVVERVVTFRLTSRLEPGTLYTVDLRTPSADSVNGFQAFDGAPLVERDAPLRFHFFTRKSTASSEQVPIEEVPSCDRIVEVFEKAGCATASCHGAAASMGLELDSAEALTRTLLNQVAHQTEIGPSAGTPLRNPDRFGVQMPLIDPGQPGNSYLLYKLMRAEQSYWMTPHDPRPCETRYPAGLSSTCVPPPVSELARLREWFLRGEAMPPEQSTAPGVLRPELRELQRFIAAGASCP